MPSSHCTVASGAKLTVTPASFMAEIGVWQTECRATRPQALRYFHDQVFAPLEGALRGLRGLYLVPHGFLHHVPLHACRDQAGDFLSDRFQVAYLPSADLLPQLPPLGSMTGSPPARG